MIRVRAKSSAGRPREFRGVAARVARGIALSAVVAVLAVPLPASAQNQPLAQRVEALEKELAALQEAATTVPTLAQTAEALSAQLAVIEQRLGKLEREQKSIPDAVAVIDQLTVRVDALEREAAALRTEVAGLERGDQGGGGGGGVVYDGGFDLATADGDYALSLTGYAQARYQAEIAGGADLETSTLRMRRARLGAAGHLGSDQLQYKILFELIRSPAALDYYVDYRIVPEAVIRVGQYKTQFTRSFITSSTRLAFPERSLAIERVRYDRDVGVGVHGLVADGRFGYYVGVGNGAGPNAVNDNIDVAAVARADVVVLGKRYGYSYGDQGGTETPTLMLGAGAIHDLVALPVLIGGTEIPVRDVDADGDVDNVRVISASGDAAFRYRGLEVVGEVVFRHERWGAILEGNPALDAATGNRGDNRNYLSFYGQATYFAIPRQLMVGARAGHARLPFLGVSGRSSALPPADRALEIDGLVELYGERGRLVGLMYTFTKLSNKDTPDPADDKEHRVILEGQLKF